jgi:Ca2+-transporting ATPase
MTERQPTFPWHTLPVPAVLEQLQTSPQGLSQAEAARRLAKFGRNELPTRRGRPLLARLLDELRNPLILILLAAGALALLLGHPTDAAVIFSVVVVDIVVGFVQEFRAERALSALRRFLAPKARVYRDGEEMEVPAAGLVPGDLVLLLTGDRVPADLRLVEAFSLETDESALTGESLPVAKTTEPLVEIDLPLGDRVNMAYMGTVVVRGRGLGVVVATGQATEFGRIAEAVETVEEPEIPIRRSVAQLSVLIGAIALALVALVVALGLAFGYPLVAMLLVAAGMAVAAVPEGLPVVVTIALAAGVERMARRRAIVRQLAAVETLGSCTVVCTDKTGTLTRNEMTVRRIWVGGVLYEVTGEGYIPRGVIRPVTPAPAEVSPILEECLRIGLLANDADLYREDGRYFVRGDPTDGALIVAALKAGLDRARELETYRLIDELPFESGRRYMATLHEKNGERLLFVKGAVEQVLEMSRWMLAPEGRVDLDPAPIRRMAEDLAAQGMRVLAFARKRVSPLVSEVTHAEASHGLTFVGLQAMVDPPRAEAAESVARARMAGIFVQMVTGDHPRTAAAIARMVGLLQPGQEVVPGRELDGMGDDDLRRRLPRIGVFARVSPEQKLRVVEQWKRRGDVVAVTGDGVNDAPALKAAHIGVAMGQIGTEVAREASDLVLADDNFATIVAAVEEGRVVFDNVRKVIMFLIPTGVGFILTIIASLLLGLPLPFLPAQIVWVNFATNSLQDIAMAFEPPEADVLRRPPRRPEEGLVTPLLVQRIVLVGAVIATGTLLVFWWYLASGVAIEVARSVALTTMVLYQNVHIFNSRTELRSAFSLSPLTNPFLVVSVLVAFGAQLLAIYWAPLQALLGTVAIGFGDWALAAAVAVTVLAVVEVEKAVRRRRSAARRG